MSLEIWGEGECGVASGVNGGDTGGPVRSRDMRPPRFLLLRAPADHPLQVTYTHTCTGRGGAAAAAHTHLALGRGGAVPLGLRAQDPWAWPLGPVCVLGGASCALQGTEQHPWGPPARCQKHPPPQSQL